MADQLHLFGPERASLPDGFRYQPDVVPVADEERLLARIRELPLADFEFHGHVGKRRVVSFGWQYDFNDSVLQRTNDIPDFLLALRDVAGSFAGIDPAELQHVLVTEYGEGAGIGWHRDKAVFGEVVGISLLSSCTFRLRRKRGATWDRVSVTAEPRSAYLLSGPARTEWEHSIPGVGALRYSVTYRNVRAGRPGGPG